MVGAADQNAEGDTRKFRSRNWNAHNVKDKETGKEIKRYERTTKKKYSPPLRDKNEQVSSCFLNGVTMLGYLYGKIMGTTDSHRGSDTLPNDSEMSVESPVPRILISFAVITGRFTSKR